MKRIWIPQGVAAVVFPWVLNRENARAGGTARKGEYVTPSR